MLRSPLPIESRNDADDVPERPPGSGIAGSTGPWIPVPRERGRLARIASWRAFDPLAGETPALPEHLDSPIRGNDGAEIGGTTKVDGTPAFPWS